MNEKKYFYSLDLFRGFCGYGVAFCHLQAFVFKNLNQIQGTSKHYGPIKEDKSVKINNSHFL